MNGINSTGTKFWRRLSWPNRLVEKLMQLPKQTGE